MRRPPFGSRAVGRRAPPAPAFIAILAFVAFIVMATVALPAAAQQAAGEVDVGTLREVHGGLYVIEDTHYTLGVPNVGIVIGSKAVLVIDTGIGRRNGEAILATAKKLAGDKKMYVTSTHFHPEHGFGAVAFKGQATLVYNDSQRAEFIEKRSGYVKLFTGLGMGALMADSPFVMPDKTYARHLRLDLGGRVVDLYAGHAGHTRGDEIVYVPDAKTVFMGDLLETASFPIFPWFPDIADTDVSPAKWLATLQWAAALGPETVVPGHGPVGTRADLTGLSDYIAGVRDEVKGRCPTASAGSDLAALKRSLVPELKARHPDWHLQQWVEPSLNAFAKDYCPALARTP